MSREHITDPGGFVYDDLHLPNTDLAREAYDYAEQTLPTYLFNHSVRTYLYARALGSGLDFDDEVLFLGCVLHDVGLTVSTGVRFEVEGADVARRFVVERDGGEEKAEIVWQAIALHTAVGIADRMRPEVALVHRGSGADVLGGVPDRLREETEARLPWLDLAASITEAVVDRARVDPRTAPPTSFPAAVVAGRGGGPAIPGWRDLVERRLDNRARLV